MGRRGVSHIHARVHTYTPRKDSKVNKTPPSVFLSLSLSMLLYLSLSLSLSILMSGCISTGDPNHPVRAWTPHEWVFGHQRYTPDERAYARCVYRNRKPDGSRTGFSRMCRLKAAEQFPMGVNAAAYASLCVREECNKMVAATSPH